MKVPTGHFPNNMNKLLNKMAKCQIIIETFQEETRLH